MSQVFSFCNFLIFKKKKPMHSSSIWSFHVQEVNRIQWQVTEKNNPLAQLQYLIFFYVQEVKRIQWEVTELWAVQIHEYC